MSRGQLTKAVKVVEWNALVREVRSLARQLDKLETELGYLHNRLDLTIGQVFPVGKQLGK